jgi:MoaA/NifB/PqqE/SkfB family radical SAM enzyme
MRTAPIVTNLRCNQNCVYCDRRAEKDVLADIQPAALRARIDAALFGGAEELIFTGGEPTLRPDLPALVGHAKGRAKRLALETNAAVVDAALAGKLREAGLDVARVNLTSDAVTRDAGGFESSRNGVRALKAAGVGVELSIAVVRSTLALLEQLPALAAAEGVSALVATVPVTAPDPAELLRYDEAAAAISALDVAARQAGLTVRLAAESGPPPCVFKSLPRAAHLFSMTPGGAASSGHRYVSACESCVVRDRCPGLSATYLARFGAPPMTPLSDDRARRRLSLVSTAEEQIERELVTANFARMPDGTVVEEAIVRVNFHCNQACEFCFVSTHLPPAADARVRAAIQEAGRRGARIVLSGGEPTLNPALLEYVALARSSSPYPVTLQSNAVRFADRALAQAVVGAGVSDVFVSLHGCTAEVSDAVTSAPGTFIKTLKGLDHLAQLNASLVLNFVICGANFRQLPEYVRFVAARWPRAMLNISYVGPSTDLVPQSPAMIPRYSEVKPHLDEAIAAARSLGLKLTGFESMCGLPLCLAPEEGRAAARAAPIGAEGDEEFVKTETCRACSLERHCYGLRRRYAELHGTAELRAV